MTSTDHDPHGHSVPEWDARYGESDQIWSGNPNGALVAEVSDLRPGTALDVGCGEGADAIWLAARGWSVTAIDVSSVALGRARAAGASAGVTVDWRLVGLAGMPRGRDGFDLVTACYPALTKEGGTSIDRLLSAVAPGGTLLFVHHAEIDRERALSHGFDPDELLGVDDVAEALGEEWEVVVHEARDRSVAGGSGAHHHQDLVLRARRTMV